MIRVIWLAWLTSVLASCGGPELSPNIVLISLDTVRADQLSAYGYARETSPALAALASEGALFRTSYSQAPNTVPTHASMFTGRYPFEHGMYAHGDPLPPAEETLAEILARNGYRTFALTSSLRFHERSGYDQGFDVFERFHDHAKNDRATLINKRALALAKESEDQPFFAFLHYFGAHGPYAAPKPYREMWPGSAISLLNSRDLPTCYFAGVAETQL
jgi:arylsulfatase A-like enzyme